LVENNIERNNIITNIVLSPTTGHHTNHKYARKELMLELVRVANEMDNKNNDLFKLADDCLIALSKENNFLAKKGIGALGVAGIALGIATILGATWLLSHTSNADQGPLANADAAIKALTNLKTNSWYESDVDETVQKE